MRLKKIRFGEDLLVIDKRSHRQQNRLESFAQRLPLGEGENILLRHYLASL